jgi:hypothetical protein
MAGDTDQQSEAPAPVPDLIERYRVRRDVWIAQADELARLKDEVRASAEREAMDIVAAARRDVRQVIADARSELLALSAHVKAALGESAPGIDPASVLGEAGVNVDATGEPAATAAWVREDTLNEILDEADIDFAALAEEAKSSPLIAIPRPAQIAHPYRTAYVTTAKWLSTPTGLALVITMFVAFASILWFSTGDSRSTDAVNSSAASAPSSVDTTAPPPEPQPGPADSTSITLANAGEKRPPGPVGTAAPRSAAAEAPRVLPPAPAPPPETAAPAPSSGTRPDPPVAAAPQAAPLASSSSATPTAVQADAPTAAATSPPAAVVAPVLPRNDAVAAETPQAPPDGVTDIPKAPAASSEASNATSTSPATIVIANARRWLDAYHRQDRTTLTSLSTEDSQLADERRADERLPAGLADVTRTLDRVSVQIAADTAVLTAVMMERSESASMPYVSPISQVWVLGGGQWKMQQARFVSAARLNQVFK